MSLTNESKIIIAEYSYGSTIAKVDSCKSSMIDNMESYIFIVEYLIDKDKNFLVGLSGCGNPREILEKVERDEVDVSTIVRSTIFTFRQLNPYHLDKFIRSSLMDRQRIRKRVNNGKITENYCGNSLYVTGVVSELIRQHIMDKGYCDCNIGFSIVDVDIVEVPASYFGLKDYSSDEESDEEVDDSNDSDYECEPDKKVETNSTPNSEDRYCNIS